MTPRHRIEWLDVRDPPEVQREELIRHRHSRYPVCKEDLDHVLGIVRVKDLLANLLEEKPLDLNAILRKPLFVPGGLRALRLLEMFRESGTHIAVVIDEYGGVKGLVTLNDVLEEITGDLGAHADPRVAVRRPSGRLRKRPLRLLGDKGYRYRRICRVLRRRAIPHVIPEREDQKKARKAKGSAGGRPPGFDREAYRRRNVVERMFNRLKQYRRVPTRYDKHALR
jgi:transposase